MKKRLPTFFCVGTPKSGSSTLHDVLKDHPHIYLPEIKETKFLVANEKYEKGVEFYINEYFSQWGNEKIAGEIDPDYMYFRDVPERMHQIFGSTCKLIFILRNPIDRAYSHYNMQRSRGQEKLSFEEVVELEPERLKKGFREKLFYGYVDRGFYFRQIRRFLEYFSFDQMMFIIFEEFITDQWTHLKEVCKFLDINADLLPGNLKRKIGAARKPRLETLQNLMFNQIGMGIARKIFPYESGRRKLSAWLYKLNSITYKYPPLSPTTREYLLKSYMPDIESLEKLLKKDLSIWKQI